MTRRQFFALLLPLVALLLGFLALSLAEKSQAPDPPPWDAEFARYVRERMAAEFVWGTEDERAGWQAYFNALDAQVKTYDLYAEVVPPWEVEASRENSSGQYPGIGIRIESLRRRREPLKSVEVIGVKPAGPAAVAGIVVGDRIVGVGDRTVAELCPEGDDEGLKDAIRGPEGTFVHLTLLGPDGTERQAKVGRARIDHGSVFGGRIVDPESRIGYLRLSAFQASTSRDCRNEVQRLLDEGMTGLILDLRRNPGGLLDQALAVADLFLAQGVIMRQRGRTGEYTEVYEASEADTFGDVPLAVLLNSGSASASEVLAGALQDHCRALIVGERSYGKFLVQIVEAVPMDVGTALFKRTTSIYETPLGHHYQRARGRGPDPMAGIRPDVFVPVSKTALEKIYETFHHEELADWNPAEKPPHAAFVDPQIGAAAAVLAGKPYYPLILPSADPDPDVANGGASGGRDE